MVGVVVQLHIVVAVILVARALQSPGEEYLGDYQIVGDAVVVGLHHDIYGRGRSRKDHRASGCLQLSHRAGWKSHLGRVVDIVETRHYRDIVAFEPL